MTAITAIIETCTEKVTPIGPDSTRCLVRTVISRHQSRRRKVVTSPYQLLHLRGHCPTKRAIPRPPRRNRKMKEQGNPNCTRNETANLNLNLLLPRVMLGSWGPEQQQQQRWVPGLPADEGQLFRTREKDFLYYRFDRRRAVPSVKSVAGNWRTLRTDLCVPAAGRRNSHRSAKPREDFQSRLRQTNEWPRGANCEQICNFSICLNRFAIWRFELVVRDRCWEFFEVTIMWGCRKEFERLEWKESAIRLINIPLAYRSPQECRRSVFN